MVPPVEAALSSDCTRGTYGVCLSEWRTPLPSAWQAPAHPAKPGSNARVDPGSCVGPLALPPACPNLPELGRMRPSWMRGCGAGSPTLRVREWGQQQRKRALGDQGPFAQQALWTCPPIPACACGVPCARDRARHVNMWS